MINKLEINAQVTDGKLPPAMEQKLRVILRNLDGKIIKLTVEQKKKIRSLNQNNYYFGVVVQAVLRMFLDEGNDVDAEEVHEYLKKHVGKLTKEIFTPDGEKKETSCTTRRLSTKEFEEYLEKIRAWAASFGVVIPLPNEANPVCE